jgi:hypothetical protein
MLQIDPKKGKKYIVFFSNKIDILVHIETPTKTLLIMETVRMKYPDKPIFRNV